MAAGTLASENSMSVSETDSPISRNALDERQSHPCSGQGFKGRPYPRRLGFQPDHRVQLVDEVADTITGRRIENVDEGWRRRSCG
jgi:hypothetical protein